MQPFWLYGYWHVGWYWVWDWATWVTDTLVTVTVTPTISACPVSVNRVVTTVVWIIEVVDTDVDVVDIVVPGRVRVVVWTAGLKNW